MGMVMVMVAIARLCYGCSEIMIKKSHLVSNSTGASDETGIRSNSSVKTGEGAVGVLVAGRNDASRCTGNGIVGAFPSLQL